MIRTLFIFIIFSFIASFSHAEGSLQSKIHHHYQSARPLGMGDAFVAVANDYNAVLYNPAGLARLEDGEINMSMEFSGSSNFASFANEVTQTGKSSSTEGQKTTEYMNLLKQYYGKQFSLRAGLLQGIWVRPHWGIAVLPADLTLDMVVHNAVGPALDFKSYLDSTIAYGYGQDFKGIPGRLSWGVTGKFVNRGYANKLILPLDLAADSKLVKVEDWQEGYTVDADIGLLYTPQLPSEGWMSAIRLAKPTFGLVVRNIGEFGFGQSLKVFNKVKTSPPEKMYRVLDVGTKFEYPNLWIFSGRGVMDFRDIGHPNFTTRKSFHLGFEFDWRVTSWWKGAYRIGVNQGYPTLGLSALFSIFSLDLVTYGEDVGSSQVPKENRTYMAKLNINI